MNHWTTDVIELEDGELGIELPEELLKLMDWSEGTIIEWIDNKDGSWSIVGKNQLTK